jgi:biotin carboxyl carrier protein
MGMKLNIRLERGSARDEHQVELRRTESSRADSGRLEFLLDQEARQADWAEVAPGVYSILIGGRSYEIHVRAQTGEASGGEIRYTVRVGTRHYLAAVQDPRRRRSAAPLAAGDGPQEILAPMPGKIAKVLVEENQEVAQGAGLLVIEAMKMQNELRAPRSGRVEKIYVAEGKGVETGFRLVRLV